MPLNRSVGNTRWAGGTPLAECAITLKAKTLTNLRTGVYVIKDTTDSECKAAGAEAANVIGVVNRNLTNHEADLDDAPAAGDELEIIPIGSGAHVWVRNGANIAAGAVLATSATGRAAAIGTATFGGMVGRALMDHDGSSTEGDLLVVL